MSRVDRIVVPVSDGVSTDDIAKAVGTFIGFQCNPPPYAPSQIDRNVYVVTFNYPDGSRGVAAMNVHNLTEERVAALSAFMWAYTPNACILCAADLPAHPHNTMPIVNGKCCDACNQNCVLPFRMVLARQSVAVAKGDAERL